MIFDSSSSHEIKKTIADLSYVIYNTYSIKDLKHHYVILVPTSHGQMHRLIPQADAVEIAFVFIYIYKQQMLWCA